MDKVKCPLCNNWNEAMTNENDYHRTECKCSAILTWNEDDRWDYIKDKEQREDNQT